MNELTGIITNFRLWLELQRLREEMWSRHMTAYMPDRARYYAAQYESACDRQESLLAGRLHNSCDMTWLAAGE